MICEGLSQHRGVEQVAFDESRAGNNGLPMTFDEVVVDDYFMTVVHQFFCDDTTDITGTAGNKHTHALTSRLGYGTTVVLQIRVLRSEERRVGKESWCRSSRCSWARKE